MVRYFFVQYSASSFYVWNVKTLASSVAAQAGLSLSWSQTPKTGFLMTRFNLSSVRGIIFHIFQELQHA